MDDLEQRLAGLSPAKRQLLEQRLRQQSGPTVTVEPPIQRRKEPGPSPLSFGQQRQWYLEQLDPGSPDANRAELVEISGPLDVMSLQQAFQGLIERHAILRTRYFLVDGEPVQEPLKEWQAEFEQVDLSHLKAETQEQELRAQTSQEIRRPFGLSNGVSYRAKLFHLGTDRYALLRTCHHIASDKWSTAVFNRELSELYAAFREGRPGTLAELPIQYADFAAWQRERLTGELLERNLAYWKETLAVVPERLDLPLDQPRPDRMTNQGASVLCEVPTDLTSRLKSTGQQEGATLFMTVLAAFFVLLYRMSGQSDLPVGTPVAGRPSLETEALAGLFINTLVLRGDCSGNPTFRELLRRVKAMALGSIAHQDLPFEKLVEELKPKRSLSYTPLFQVMFDYLNTPVQSLSLSGVDVRRLELDYSTSAYDLSLFVLENNGRLQLTLEYSTDLFYPETAQRFLDHYHILLQEIVRNPESHIDELHLMDEAEQSKILVEWNDTGVEWVGENLLHHLFEHQVGRTPDAPAVSCAGMTLSYRELDDLSNRLSARLLELDVKPDELVGICIEPSLEMIVGLLGILKSGAAYLPLDPEYPLDRLKYMLEEANLRLVVTQERLGGLIPSSSVRQIFVEQALERGGIEDQFPPQVAENSLAYAIFTSGSTGRPKGVLIEHRAAANFVRWAKQTYELRPGDRMLQFAALSFDTAVEEIFPTLSAGACLVVIPGIRKMGFSEFQQVVSREGITILDLPTAFWNLWAEDLARSSVELPEVLRLVIVGGERALPTSYAAWWKRAGPSVRWINTYGPTEAAVVCLSYEPRPDWDQTMASILPIGRPIANAHALILDERQQLVPAGFPGELYIGGAGLGRGYLNHPEWTAEKFVPLPPALKNLGPGFTSTRLYRTGDRARWLPDGNIDFLGRTDRQVKLRGFRVEPEEIESVLRQCPGISEAAVLPRSSQSGDIQLAAFLVQKFGALSVEEIRSFLNQKLPEYLIPTSFTFIETMPRLPGGKPDLNSLPDPLETAQGVSAGGSEPHSALEEVLAGLWAEVLGLERVGADENYFDLGGHSLLAIRLLSYVTDVLQVNLPLSLIFENPTVMGMAAALEQRVAENGQDLYSLQRRAGLVLRLAAMNFHFSSARRALLESLLQDQAENSPGVKAIQPRASSSPAPLTFVQERMWFLDQLEESNEAYHVVLAFHLYGRLDPNALETSLNKIINRHAALRTTFGMIDARPVQMVNLRGSVSMVYHDLTLVNLEVRQQEAIRLAKEFARQPFDLEKGPLLLAQLICLGEGLQGSEHLFVLAIHHIICDEWSLEVLFRELSELYTAEIENRPPQLPALPVQYTDYAHYERERLPAVLEKDLSYWKEQLSDAPQNLDLPYDFPRPAVQSFQGDSRTRVLPNDLARALQELSRQERVTFFTTLLAAFQVLLYRYSGQEDFCIGFPIADRRRVETRDLIGCFLNTLVLRGRMEDRLSFRELLARTREVVLGALDHQELPFEKLAEELKPERELGRSPFFQVFFVLQQDSGQPLSLPGIDSRRVELDLGIARFDLSLYIKIEAGQMRLKAEYSSALFRAETIERMLGHFQTLLEGIVGDPRMQISKLPILAASQRRQMLVEWNDTSMEYNRQASIPEFFEAQVRRVPQEQALLFEGGSWTFQELDERAGLLAEGLKARGAGPGVVVGILMKRSPEMVAALFGILKTGAAYLPLDPSYPEQRLSFMLQDAAVSLLVTQRSLSPKLPQGDTGRVWIEEIWKRKAPQPVRAQIVSINPDSPAYVIYTSGSTGQPKGVVGTQRGIINRISWMQQAFPYDHGEVACQKTAMSFVDSVAEIFGPLLHGIPLVIMPDEVVKDPHRLVEILGARRVTRIVLVPSLLRAVLDAVPDIRKRLPVLNLWMCSGEALSPELSNRFHFAMPGAMLVNLYGSSEVAADVTCYLTQNIESGMTLPIGRPIGNTHIYLLDPRRQPVPVGVTGEIYVGGDGLALGYLNRPDLTGERFVPVPFKDEIGSTTARLFKTGDLGRYRSDGNLVYLGRKDQQVKVRGYRVELGEVEAVLLKYPEVRQAAVLARGSPTGEGQLIAYLEPMPGARPEPQDLRGFLSSQLPEYMLPSAYALLDALPLTPGGKIDRLKLPEPVKEDLPAAGDSLEPRDGLEFQLVQIWEELLGVHPVGIHDNFFDLGGHSLMAIQLFARMEERFARRLPLSTLFKTPTIAGLANQLRRANKDLFHQEDWPILIPIQPEGSQPPFFCVHGFGGGVLGFSHLARLLGPDQPLYGIQAWGYDRPEDPDLTIESMAERYVKAVRAFQPQGPYRIGGYCVGGVIAFEMARQLQAQGQEASLVAIFEGYAPIQNQGGKGRLSAQRLYNFLMNLPYWSRDYFQLGAAEMWRDVKRKALLNSKVALRRMGMKIEYTPFDLVGEDIEFVTATMRRLMEIEIQAQMDYRPGPYPGSVVLFRIDRLSLLRADDPQMGWGKLASGGVRTCMIAGRHNNIMESPQVEILAAQLRESLRQAG